MRGLGHQSSWESELKPQAQAGARPVAHPISCHACQAEGRRSDCIDDSRPATLATDSMQGLEQHGIMQAGGSAWGGSEAGAAATGTLAAAAYGLWKSGRVVAGCLLRMRISEFKSAAVMEV